MINRKRPQEKLREARFSISLILLFVIRRPGPRGRLLSLKSSLKRDLQIQCNGDKSVGMHDLILILYLDFQRKCEREFSSFSNSLFPSLFCFYLGRE